jgi:hypothetical protein
LLKDVTPYQHQRDIGVFENIFETVNSGFAQALYEDYLRDPSSVPPEWRELFEDGLMGRMPRETAEAELGGDEGKAATPTTGSSESRQLVTGPALRLLHNMEASLAVPTATSSGRYEGPSTASSSRGGKSSPSPISLGGPSCWPRGTSP